LACVQTEGEEKKEKKARSTFKKSFFLKQGRARALSNPATTTTLSQTPTADKRERERESARVVLLKRGTGSSLPKNTHAHAWKRKKEGKRALFLLACPEQSRSRVEMTKKRTATEMGRGWAARLVCVMMMVLQPPFACGQKEEEDHAVYIDIAADKAEDGGGDIEYCADDTDCGKGYRCPPATHECTKIPDCLANSGREHGARHGECIRCTSDAECGWFPGAAYDFCWPDGACRDVPPFRILSTRIAPEDGDGVLDGVRQGDRVCVTVSPVVRQDLFRVDVTRLDLCASSLYFRGAHAPVVPGVDKSLGRIVDKEGLGRIVDKEGLGGKEDLDQDNGFAAYRYPGILYYDADNPGTSGCRTDPDRVRVHTVFKQSAKKTRARAGSAAYDGEHTSDKRHHFHTTTLSTVTKGQDTVCFDARAMTAPDVPIYIQAKVDVAPARTKGDRELSPDQLIGLYRVYALLHDDNADAEWSGVVPSPRRRVPEASSGEPPIPLHSAFVSAADADASAQMFVSCPTGVKFDGVAGVCEQPSVSKNLFFWMLIASVIALIVGSVLFAIRLRAHNEHMRRVIESGQILLYMDE